VAGKKLGRRRRWDDRGDARVWARIRFLREHDGLNVRAAARRLENRGWFTFVADLTSRDGKRLWLSKPAAAGSLFEEVAETVPAGTEQREGVAEVLRQRYYAANRRRKTDAAFAKKCDRWLRFEREYAASGDAVAAFKRSKLDA